MDGGCSTPPGCSVACSAGTPPTAVQPAAAISATTATSHGRAFNMDQRCTRAGPFRQPTAQRLYRAEPIQKCTPQIRAARSRQFEVLEPLVRGYSQVEVAELLVVAESTVRKYLAALQAKSGMRSPYGLTAWAVREFRL
jgi:DNA-binding NarL/FixJ family response regulator